MFCNPYPFITVRVVKKVHTVCSTKVTLNYIVAIVAVLRLTNQWPLYSGSNWNLEMSVFDEGVRKTRKGLLASPLGHLVQFCARN